MDGDTGSCAFEKRKNPKGFREKKTKVGKCKRKSLVDTLHVPIGQGKAGVQVKDPRIKERLQDDDTEPSSECDESLEASYYREQDEQQVSKDKISTTEIFETAENPNVKKEDEQEKLLTNLVNALHGVVTGTVNGSTVLPKLLSPLGL
jgi:hypothetical protein